MKIAKTLIISLILTCILSFSFYAQNLPEVITIREVELADGANEIVFQNYYNKYFNRIAANSRGMGGWIMKGNRGNRKDKYILATSYDLKSVRDYYFPQAGKKISEKYRKLVDKAGVDVVKRYIEQSKKTDFVVLGYDKFVDPQIGEVISVRYPPVKEGFEEAFEKFVVDELHPAFQQNMKGMYSYILKGDRGDMKGKYALLWVFVTEDRLNSFFPSEESSGSEEWLAGWEKLSPVVEKYESFLAYESAEHTDYIVVY